jgi:hypothetical protein
LNVFPLRAPIIYDGLREGRKRAFMNLERLQKVLRETTVVLRRSELVESLANYADEFELVDCHLSLVCVDKRLAESYRTEFVDILASYPEPRSLAKGPSFIEVGCVLGGEETAFQFFALGKVLGLWQVITPFEMGVKGPAADELARIGWVIISGLKKAA